MAKRFPELAALEDRTECRQILLDIVDRNVERLHEILKTHEENADAEAERVVARKGFDTGPRCKQLSDYELKYDRAYRQSLAMYEKMTGERRGAWNGKDETWRGGPRAREPIAPPPYGKKSDEYCMGPAGKAAGRARSVSAGFGTRSNESAPATGIAAGGSRSESATVRAGVNENPGATEWAAGGSGSEPANLGGAERGWESVAVQDADIVACQGFLPARYAGADGDTRDGDVGVGGGTQDGGAGVESDAQRGDVGVASDTLCEGAGVVGDGGPVLPPAAACDGTAAARGEEILTNEPKLDQDVTTTQNEKHVEVVANSGAISGLDRLRTNPRPACGRKGDEDPNSKSEGDREGGRNAHAGGGGTTPTNGEVCVMIVLFVAIQVAPWAFSAEHRQAERAGEQRDSVWRQVVATESDSAMNRQAAPASQDLTTSSTLRRIRPGTDLLAEVEDRGQYLDHVLPVIGVVRLHDELPAGRQCPVYIGKQLRRQDAQMGLPSVVKWLGMIEVNLRNCAGGHVGIQKCLRVFHRKANVGEPSLIGSPGRVADDHGEHVDRDMVEARTRQRTRQREAAIAAAQVEYQGSAPPEDRRPVERAGWRQTLDRRLHPLRFGKDPPRDRHAVLKFETHLFLDLRLVARHRSPSTKCHRDVTFNYYCQAAGLRNGSERTSGDLRETRRGAGYRFDAERRNEGVASW